MSNYSWQGSHDLGLFPSAPPRGTVSQPKSILFRSLNSPQVFAPAASSAWNTSPCFLLPLLDSCLPNRQGPVRAFLSSFLPLLPLILFIYDLFINYFIYFWFYLYLFDCLVYTDTVIAGPRPAELSEETVPPHPCVGWVFFQCVGMTSWAYQMAAFLLCANGAPDMDLSLLYHRLHRTEVCLTGWILDSHATITNCLTLRFKMTEVYRLWLPRYMFHRSSLG